MFLKAEDETAAALTQMGYQSLADRSPTASIAIGTGMAVEDLEDLFVESAGGAGALPSPFPRASGRW
jgi:hypothetical protein